MKKTTLLLLFICIGLTFSSCKNVDETPKFSITPTNNIEPEYLNAPENSGEPEGLNAPENSGKPEGLNEFEALEEINENTIILDNNIFMLITKNTHSYKIETKHFTRKNHNGDLNVEYPQFIGKNKNLQKVNALIYELVDQNVLKEDEINELIDSNITYEIKKASDDMVSIIFTGMNNSRTAAHPDNKVFTFNYDLKASKLIELSHVTHIDKHFLKKCKGALGKQTEKEVSDSILLTNADLDILIHSLKDQNSLFF